MKAQRGEVWRTDLGLAAKKEAGRRSGLCAI
jgi:hypothetical protein